MQKYRALCLMVTVVLVAVSPTFTYGQQAGELIAVDYPSHLEQGEPLNVTMTVENTGTGTWRNLCAFVGYRSSDGTNTKIEIDTCHTLGDLDPGAVGTYSCSLESSISGIVEKIWAGVGAPFG